MSDSILLINDTEYSYEYKKLDENIEFFCFRCGKRKISKKFAEIQVGGSTKKICNGCYGRLLSLQQ
jgi:hypothetical protein